MYTLQTDLRQPSGLTVDQLNQACLYGLQGLGQSFADAEAKYGINALFMIAHAAIESSWGRSEIAITKNNIFGIAAFDSNPGMAQTFASFADCINAYADFVSHVYLTAPTNPATTYFVLGYNYTVGQYYSGGTTIHNLFVHYSSSGDFEGQNICNIMNQFHFSAVAPAQQNVLRSQPNAEPYTIKAGDTLSGIAAAHNINGGWQALYNFDNNNAIIGANPDLIFPGTQIWLPEGSTQQAQAPVEPSAPQYRTVTVQAWPGQLSTLSGIAQAELGNASRWPEIAQLNNISAPKYIIYPGQVIKLPN